MLWKHIVANYVTHVPYLASMPASLRSKIQLGIFLLAVTIETNHAFLLSGNHKPSIGTFKNPALLGGGTATSQIIEEVHEFHTWQLQAGFFDDLMSGKLFTGDENAGNGDDDDEKKKETNDTDEEASWTEADFRNVVESRNIQTNSDNKIDSDSKSSIPTSGNVVVKEEEMEEGEFDGYAMRDVIYNKWGVCYDIDFQPVTTFGFRDLYLNVLPFRLGGKRFRHETELDYLCHLQAVVRTDILS